ncbi:hypothetical protein, conserved [Babesia bigemina]|uniref:Uncharacterized protein n=1 Tax=Babesia bigemina TaxID=5866 RepID=A0A061D8Q3_BABBI|nr:hypothetical protein, conserved [Babesia bigemina]CDR96322.1 hypothetical protein, conserved [Babesia bigemina]|eukprot:XP_012768508.1 hypothetical protein, conserved [Babesia bigemina]
MQLPNSHASRGRGRQHNADTHQPRHVDNTRLKVYNIDDYEKLVSGAQENAFASQLEISPGTFLTNLATGTNRILGELAELSSGPFPTYNNQSKLAPYADALKQATAPVANPMPMQPAMQSPGVVPQVMPQPVVAMPQVAAMPPVAEAVPVVPVMQQPVQAMPAAMPVVQMQPQEPASPEKVNAILKDAFAAKSLPALPDRNFNLIIIGVVGVAVVVFIIAGIVVRIKQKKKSSKRS